MEPEIDLTGRTLGDFRVRRSLGRGGMGQVYLAEQISLKREVALKTLRPDLAANQSALERFEAEAKAVAKATHANIVQIYVIDKAQVDQHVVHYLALEYIEGRNLREFLEKKGTPDVLSALSIMHQVSSALQRASELGIIHRDIKPENILLTRQGEVKVADFGLSRCFSDPAQPVSLTQSGVTMGTPLYMAPEQVEQRPTDPRTDIYSFGVTCYHMLAGQPPFKGNSPFEIAVQHVQKEPPPLLEIRPDLPVGLGNLIHRMMAKNPDDRPQTAREIVREISRLRDMLVGISLPPLGDLGDLSGQLDPSRSPSDQHKTWMQRHKQWILGTLAIILAAVIGLAGSYLYAHITGRGVRPPHVPADDSGANPPANVLEREKELQKLVEDDANSPNVLAALKHTLDLGVFYLQEGKLDEADAFFKKIGDKPEYRDVGQLGAAMVQALRAEPEPSNQLFKQVLAEKNSKDKQDKTRENLRSFWKIYTPWRKMIAVALYHNKVNQPAMFPQELESWLQAPK